MIACFVILFLGIVASRLWASRPSKDDGSALVLFKESPSHADSSFLKLANTKIKRDDCAPSLEPPSEWSSKLGSCTLVGFGGYGCVYECDVECNKTVGAKVAIKEVKALTTEEDIDDLQREIHMLQQMRGSDYVLSSAGRPDHIPDRVVGGEKMFLMTELLNLGSLADIVEVFLLDGGLRGMDPLKYNETASRLPAELPAEYQHKARSYQHISSNGVVLALFYQAVRGVKQLHDLNKVHRDLKLENVMVSDHNDKVYAAVIDLGMVSNESSEPACRPTGTLAYMAPEIFAAWYYEDEATQCSKANDVWALGVMLYVILLGQLPPYVVEDESEHEQQLLRYNVSKDLQLEDMGENKIENVGENKVENVGENKVENKVEKRGFFEGLWKWFRGEGEQKRFRGEGEQKREGYVAQDDKEKQLMALIHGMLQQSPQERIKVDVLLERLTAVTMLYTTDDDRDCVDEMLNKSPSTYEAKVPTPPCLDQADQ